MRTARLALLTIVAMLIAIGTATSSPPQKMQPTIAASTTPLAATATMPNGAVATLAVFKTISPHVAMTNAKTSESTQMSTMAASTAPPTTQAHIDKAVEHQDPRPYLQT